MKLRKRPALLVIGCVSCVAIVATMAFVLFDMAVNNSGAYSSDDVVSAVTAVHEGSTLESSSDVEVAGDEHVTDYVFVDASGMEYHVTSGVEYAVDDFGRATDSTQPYIVDGYANAYFQSQSGHDELISVLSDYDSVSVTEDNGAIVDIRIPDANDADAVRSLLRDKFGSILGVSSDDSLGVRCDISVYVGDMNDIQTLVVTSLSEFVAGGDATE